MIALTAEDLSDLRRWLFAGAIVVLVYAAAAAAIVSWHEVVAPVDPASGIIVEFAPEQIAAPEQVQSEAVPDQTNKKVEKEQEEKVEAKGDEPIQEKVEPKPLEQQPRQAVPLTTPPPPELPKTAARPAGPVQGSPTKPIDPRAIQTWVGEIAALLERKKRYPPAAHARREQGVTQVEFTLDPRGHVVDSRIVRSSGSRDLDEEALSLLRRAEPFPPSPARSTADELAHLTVPIRFSLK
jgi:protein TonB